jgi:hypothetical protein
MEVKELRVGNNIKIDGIVVTIDERTIFDFNHDKRVKEPIPLTEDILLKCGFKFINGLGYRNKYLQSSILKGNFDTFHWNYYGISIYLENLHQLQNLYFALTNQELTITL